MRTTSILYVYKKWVNYIVYMRTSLALKKSSRVVEEEYCRFMLARVDILVKEDSDYLA